ncbi:serpentine type 7TM GPCR chemoreceptor srt domain-containing protein [Ditylenchus destructor]|uniref:Serpentine type 7TM GPCR chemoreceptor srt domain-containing protein n=1 Tax=Ditylenchus destructor TaxID=166010 RepID=A0AAD4MW62_9BILA|nr:serpentine type 7TM GPCR chemoreceptor srt domain-containing protein [Ditylenchus destructor]
MEDFLRGRPAWNEHYNCSLYDWRSIPLEQRYHPYLSTYRIVASCFLEVICALVLFAISRPKYIKQASYKLMFALELSEMVELGLVGIIAPMFGLLGIVYCSNPILDLCVGTMGLGIWYFEGQLSILLALNRCLIIYDADRARQLFQKHGRVYIWLGVVIVISLIMLCFGAPVVYSAAGGGFFFDPHIIYRTSYDPYFFNMVHFVFNHVVALALVVIYLVFGTLIYRRQKMGLQRYAISKNELSLFLQISIICFLTVLSCIGYAYQGFLFEYKPLIIITADAYLLYLGSPAFVYLVLNKSVRYEVACLLAYMAGRSVVAHASDFNSTAQRGKSRTAIQAESSANKDSIG